MLMEKKKIYTEAVIAYGKKLRKFLGDPGVCPSENFGKSRLKCVQFEAFWKQI